jgi:Cu-Zn family superoxide dismutase
MRKPYGPLSLSLLLVACGAASKTEPATAMASAAAMAPGAAAALEPRSGSQVAGTAEFADAGGGELKVTIRVANATPGKHGVHLHETGDCAAPDAASAGKHFNPTNMSHGGPEGGPHHSGDLGNIDVGADGTGTLTLTTKDLTLADGPNGVVGRAVIVHEKIDDLTSQPAGNSGPRVSCGVVKVR